MLQLHRAERTDTLAGALAEVLIEPLPDPMATEIVAVPARGVERWLTQRLALRLGTSAGGDGIAANIDFSSPASLTDDVLSAAAEGAAQAGREEPGAAQLWRPDVAVWSVLAVLDEMIDDPVLSMLARHVGPSGDAAADDPRAGRRYATARHIAELFDRYARARPTMLTDWAGGSADDGAGGTLPSDMQWQPRFWRAVRERIGMAHPVEHLQDVCEMLRNDPAVTDLPPRLSVFGPTRIGEAFRQIAVALGAHRDVHLFVPHPGPALWRSVAATTQPADLRRSAWRAPELANPLLASLSHDSQELQLRLAADLDLDTHHRDTASASGTVLGAIQTAIRDDVNPRSLRGQYSSDDSVEIHACHGPERQVEALRDRLLHVFAADPTLQPRDVIIMCPDVEDYAPLLRGAFGQRGLDHPAAALRVRLADRGLRHLNPVLDVVATVVELGVGRVTAGQVGDLLALDPVRARFAMSDDDLEWVREWLVRSGIRWGIDEPQRARFGLSGIAQGTFDAGLDRIALGVVAEEDDGDWLGTALPLEGLESTQIDLVGRLTEFVARLSALLHRLVAAAPATSWVATLTAIITELTTTESGQEWQQAQATRLITEALAEGAPDVLRPADIRDLVATLIAARPSRANFRTGELTVCTLVPMRSVPHRVVVLLGIDSDAFPRALRIDGDDVLGRVPLLGERNPRDEDRQLFLDALTAAQDKFLVFYTGADPVSGTRVPSAVVVSELADAVATVTGSDEAVVRHTLHGFDARNFEAGAFPGIRGPLSFDSGLLAGAQALREQAAVVPPIAETSLADPVDDDGEVELSSLIAFFANPIEGFVRQRLGARMPEDATEDAESLEVAVSGLDEWGIGDRLLRRVLDGADLHACQMAELRRGTLPPREFGRRELQRISRNVTLVRDAAIGLRHGAPRTADFVCEPIAGTRLHGSVGEVFGTGIVEATYSKVRAKHRLAAWIRLVALAAAQHLGAIDGPAVEMTTVVGRADRKAPGVTAVQMRVPDDPVSVLAELIRIRRLGLKRALPLPLDAGEVYGAKRAAGSSERIAMTAAAARFDNLYGANTNPYVRFVYGNDVTSSLAFTELTRVEVPDDPGWSELGMTSGEGMFAALATRIWQPIVDHEVIR